MSRFDLSLLRRRLGVVLLAAAIALGFAQGSSAAATDEAQAAVQRLVEEIIKILSTDELDTQQEIEQLGQVIDREADLDILGRLSLGRHWRDFSEVQQEEYRELFRRLMLRKFAGYLNAYAGQDLGPTAELFQITGSQELSGDDILVETRITPAEKPPLRVGWRVRERDSRALVIDVIVGEASLLITQRSEFGAVIGQRGVDGFLDDLRGRV